MSYGFCSVSKVTYIIFRYATSCLQLNRFIKKWFLLSQFISRTHIKILRTLDGCFYFACKKNSSRSKKYKTKIYLILLSCDKKEAMVF